MELGALTGPPLPRVSMAGMRCCCTAWRVAIALPRWRCWCEPCSRTSPWRSQRSGSADCGASTFRLLSGRGLGSQPRGRCRRVTSPRRGPTCICEWQVMPRCACSSRVRLTQRLACRERSSSTTSSRRWRWAA